MLHYNATGVTKAPEIKISRPVFALLIEANIPFASLGTEQISIQVERAQGSNTTIGNVHKLSRILPLAAKGVPAIIQLAGSFRALLPLAPGAVTLGENESIKITLENLDALKTYKVSSIESANLVPAPYSYELKVMQSDEVAKKFDIPGYTGLHIDGYQHASAFRLTYSNGVTVNYEPAELRSMAETDDPFYVMVDGAVVVFPSTCIVLDVSEIRNIEIIKSAASPMYLTLRA